MSLCEKKMKTFTKIRGFEVKSCLSFSKKEETTVGGRRMLQSARSRNVLSGLDRQGEITVSTNSNLYKLGTRPVSSAPTINYALDRLVNVRSLSGSSSEAARGNDRHGHVHPRIFNCGGLRMGGGGGGGGGGGCPGVVVVRIAVEKKYR